MQAAGVPGLWTALLVALGMAPVTGSVCRADKRLRHACIQAEGAPRLGSALPVVLYGLDSPRAGQMALPGPGAWAKLRNVGACVIDGQLQVGAWKP